MPRRSPRALALWGAAILVALVTAVVVAGDLATLHRRAAGLGPERRRGGRHPRPARRHRARGSVTLDRAVRADRSCPAARSPIASGSRARGRGPGARGIVRDRAATSRPGGVPGSTASSRPACGRCGSWSPTRSGRVRVPRSTCSPPTTRRRPRRRRRHHRRRRRRRDRARHRPRPVGSGAVARARGVTLLVDPDQADRARRRPGQRCGHARARPARGRRAPLASAPCRCCTPIILGIVQGLSEFLPISSSGHLILVPELFGWTELTSNDSLNKTFDVALHVGTLDRRARVLPARGVVVHGRGVAVVARDVRSRRSTSASHGCCCVTAVPGAIIGALFTERHRGQPR